MVADLLHWRGTRLDLPRTGLAAGDLSNVPIVGAAPPTERRRLSSCSRRLSARRCCPTTGRLRRFNNAGLREARPSFLHVSTLSASIGAMVRPVPGLVPVDQFSARFERTLNVTGGIYRFSVQADDGVRVWVGGELVIDEWHPAAPPFIRRNARSRPHLDSHRILRGRRTGQDQLLMHQMISQFPDWQASYFDNI
ncbi:MAG: PA14 domain-containing protein [Caldilineaceae bacterium]